MNEAAGGRVVVITGASRNIGLATAKALVKRGYRLAILARNAENLMAAAETLGNGTLAIPADVTSHVELFRAFDQVAAHFGRIDGLINNAGVAHLGKVEHLDAAKLVEQVHLNFIATVYGCQGIIPHLRRQGGGRIVNISSAASRSEVFSHMSIYAATKAAVDRFTDELRHEVQGDKIAVTSFIPSDTMTSFGFGWDPALVQEAFACFQDRGKYWPGALDVDVVGEAIAHCFDVPPNVAYELVVLRSVGKYIKEMLPED